MGGDPEGNVLRDCLEVEAEGRADDDLGVKGERNSAVLPLQIRGVVGLYPELPIEVQDA